MQRVQTTVWSPASDRKIYGVWVAVIWVALFAGFGLDFTHYVGATPPPPFVLHFQAFIFVLFGTAILWTGEIIVTLLNFSPGWREAIVRLVEAWGYAG